MGRSGSRQVNDANISEVMIAPASIGGGVVFSREPVWAGAPRTAPAVKEARYAHSE